MPSKITHIQDLAKAIGLSSALSILARRALHRSSTVSVKSGNHRIMIRPGDSDLFVAGQIFGAVDYDLGDTWSSVRHLAKQWRQDGDIPVILDIGSNAGYSAIYFATMCQDSIVIAVEADADTFHFMKRNVAPYSNILPIHAAVWSHEEGVNFSEPTPLGSWAGKVAGDSGKTPSLLLSSVISSLDRARPLILKLDVEGAEREICEASPEIFRDVPVIIIEPHDFMLPGAGCLAPLYTAIGGRSVDTLLKGENIFLVESKLRSSTSTHNLHT